MIISKEHGKVWDQFEEEGISLLLKGTLPKILENMELI